MTYCYYKAQPSSQSSFNEIKQRIQRRVLHLIPNLLIVIGATAVTTVTYPMLSYNLQNSRWEQRKVVAPVPKDQVETARTQAQMKSSVPANPAAPVVAYQEVQPEIIDDIDYTKAENWFTGNEFAKSQATSRTKDTTYTISIPKLNIENMTVEIGGTNLDKHLIHYPGTALPGEYGNPVIFGHSVLPVFYNPKSYMAVFSKLPTLDEGDEIFVSYDGIEYRYVVDSYHEVQPDQVEVLEQRYDRQTITLITCVPPGTYSRRGVILAVLEKL